MTLLQIKCASIVTKCLDIVWNNDHSITDIISFVKNNCLPKKKFLEEKARLDSNSQGDAHDPLNVANIFEENEVEEDAAFKYEKD